MSQGKEDLSFTATTALVNSYEVMLCVSTAVNHYTTRSLGVSVVEYFFCRNFLNWLFMGIILAYRRLSPLDGFTPQTNLYFWTRAVVGQIGFFTFTWTYKLLPLGIGATILATNPILITLLAYFLIKEPVSQIDTAAILISFSGIAIMSLAKGSSLHESEQSNYIMGIAVACFTSFVIALTTILGRKLKSLDTNTLMFNHMGFGTLGMFIVLLVTPQDRKPLSFE